jgi:glycosyltransferase involved in cell wall biosynthesis
MESIPIKVQKDSVSVIVVTYKQKDYLYQTIDSILSQNYANMELIIADDGTPDLNVEKIKKYIDNNNKGNIVKSIILYDGNNRGTVKNINRALAVTKGEYIKVIGGDDTYVNSDVISREIAFMKDHTNLYGAVSKCQQCDAFMNPIKDERVEKSNANISRVLKMDFDRSREYIAKNDIFPIAVQSTIFRRAYYEDLGGCDEDYIVIDDSPTVLNILQNHEKFAFFDIFSVNHRSNVGISTSRELFSPKRIKYYKDCVTYGEKEIRPNPGIYGKGYSRFIPDVNKYVYKMAQAKSNGKGKSVYFFLTLKYLPALVYYFIHNSKKVIYRIKLSRSKKS